MTATDHIVSQAKRVREGYVAATRSTATELVPSGSWVGGWEIVNPHLAAITVSGVPLWENPNLPEAPRVGTTVAASGTERSNIGFEASSGLRFFSTSTGGDKAHVRVYTD